MTAEELLMMSDDVETYIADDALVIDPESRTILTPVNGLILGVESDEEAERVHFVCPRFVGDNIDLSVLQIRTIYQNANGDKDFRICTDVKVDGDNVRFSWLLSRKVTRYKGKVKFIVCAIRSKADGTIRNEWNTTLAEGISLEGLEVDIPEEEFEEPKDIVMQLLSMLDEKASEISENIETQKESAMDEIKAEGQRVIESIPEDYSYTANLAEENKQFKANAIKQTYSGETIEATDSAEAKLEGLRVFGRSEQASTTGAQLLPYPYLITSNTANGGTFNVQEDGGIACSGTPTSYIGNTIWKTRLMFADKFTVCFLGNAQNVLIDANIYDENDTNIVLSQKSLRLNESTFIDVSDYSKNCWLYLTVKRHKDNVAMSGIAYPMIVAGNVAPTEYEPYTGGKPSPSVEYQQPFDTVGKDGSVDVVVHSSNFFDVIGDVESSNGVVKTVEENRLTLKSATNATTENTSYFNERYEIPISRFCNEKEIVLSVDKMESIGSVSPYILLYGCDEVGNRYNSIQIRSSGSYVFPITKEMSGIRFAVYANAGEICSKGDGVIYTGLRINLGSKALPWTSGTKQSLAISTPSGLPAIQVTDPSLATYTDQNGIMWCADEVDFDRGKYVKRVNTITFDGVNTAMTSTDAFRTGGYNYAYKIVEDKKLGVGLSLMSSIGLSNDITSMECVGSTNDNKSISVTFSDERTGITADDTKSTRISKINAVLQQIPVTVMYILDTPIETDLTAEEIEAYRALTSNYPTTTILNDENAHVEVTLVADTKNHIEQNYVPKSEFLSVVDRVSALEQRALA